jgi:predicted transcriptional regulator
MKNLERLFGSKTRVKLLALFLLNPERAFFVREITRRLNKRINSVRRELQILSAIGFLKKKTEGRKTYYQANKKFIFFEELQAMVEKSGSTEDKISDDIKKLGEVVYAAWSGFFTGNEHTNVDLIMVGNVKKDKVTKFVNKLEKETGKEINYTVLTSQEFIYRKKCKDKFLTSILSNCAVIIDNANE